MQHQSQDPSKGSPAGTTGLLASQLVVTSEEIERHIAAGKRMQAEAIAAALSGVCRRVGALFQRRPSRHETAVPHGA